MRSDARVEDLYREHVGDAIRLAFLLTGDREEAKDLAHDAFVRAAGRLASLRREDSFGRYLRRAVVNACISHRRRLDVRRTYVKRNQREEPTVAMPDVEGRDAIARAISALPPRQRAAIVLRYWADLSESDIAVAMGCSVQAVRNLLQRGLSTLRSSSEVQR